ncbi:expressed protein [Phakopsora pachyrhizi]|uniref:Expressed protein n=1 Tax=Phakopsora pachyrhizi TaxID=170000 RepID=A0AAV0BPY0_PHAPC|nr:expressed protein [Phakopsora pachyrhizi]
MENVSKAVEAPKNSKKYSEKLTRELDFKSIQVEKVKDKKLYSQTNMPRTQGLSKEKAMQKLLESNKIEQKKPIYANQSSQSSEKGVNLEGNEEKKLIKKYGGFIEDGLIKYALDDFLNRYKSPEIHSSLRKENINAWKEKVSTYKKANIKCDIAKISKYEDETGKFQQYLYFLSKAQNEEQQIWWSEKLYNELQRDTGYRAFDINITLRLGDLIHSTFEEHSARDPELWKNAREKYNKILGNSQQLKTDFSKRWVLGGGKNWLNRNFKDSAGEPLYDSFVKKIRMTPEELIELKTTGLQKHKLKDKNGVPPSLKTLWLDLGLNPEVMIEFFTVLEAFRSKKVNKSSKNLGNLPDVQDLGRKFDSVALSQRYLELMKYFENNPKEMEATISWFAENICPTRKFIESILKIGAQNGKSECTRWRYKVLLFSHWIARQVQKMFNVCAKL